MKLTAENVKDLDFSKNPQGLLPAIVQDKKTSLVLMLGYVNAESLHTTFRTGNVTFYSRSKERLWTKGETSGNTLDLDSAFFDCDRDTVLFLVQPQGPTCHLGENSCFGESYGKEHVLPGGQELLFLKELEQVLHAKQADANSPSYTSRLLAAGVMKIAQKVGEEGVEVALEAAAGSDELLLEEAADLMYHYLLLLRIKGKRLKDVVNVLETRHPGKK
jgi:phosphoribosyl-ATP pyrophosphohydrolase/phosphoribosyl-AMP cyclohydrolase